MCFRLTPRSMTLDDLELISLNFQIISWDFADFGRNNTKQMKIGHFYQRRRCKHVKFEQFLACFRVAWVCQRQLGFLVSSMISLTSLMI